MSSSIHLRHARQEDEKAIRAIIHDARINPFALHWQHFLLVVDENDQILGTGQIKTHYDGTRELASIAVRPAFKGQGIARMIIERLLEENPPPLYLTCRSPLAPLYQKFGFQPLERNSLNGYFKRLVKLVSLIEWLGPSKDKMLVMGIIPDHMD
jgi:N-acetylglutamate synthase-like GNAT family acetyltransferase